LEQKIRRNPSPLKVLLVCPFNN